MVELLYGCMNSEFSFIRSKTIQS